MKQSLEEALPFAEAFAGLLHPFAEVVVHDLELDQIVTILNPISRREVGDSSYLDRIEFRKNERVIGPYEKTNWDGRKLKSISVILRNKKGKAEGFLCVNVDVSVFESASQIIGRFLKNQAEISEESTRLFKEDLYERINLFVQSFCKERQTSVELLSKDEKREIIHTLSAKGAFSGKNAPTYVGRVLGISRATVYNYLKEKK